MPTEDVDMTIADLTFVAFTFCNSLRLLAYIPQITKAVRDQSGAEAISSWTWGLFLASNVSAIAYAVENKADWTMASMFVGNALGCGTILLVAAWKRSLHRRRSKDCQLFTRRHRVDSSRSASVDQTDLCVGVDIGGLSRRIRRRRQARRHQRQLAAIGDPN